MIEKPTAEEHIREAAQAEYFALHTSPEALEEIEGLNRQRDSHLLAAKAMLEEQGVPTNNGIMSKWLHLYTPGG